MDLAAWFIDKSLGFAVANLLGALKNILSYLLQNTIIPLVTNVMSYQNFFSNGVNTGWTITRDFANLFFALVLLIIAIATVLNIGALSNYTAKRMLPNFIFVALFINFSKAIVGFLIDISQIIMISFYNSFGSNIADTIMNASKFAESSSESNTNTLILNIFIIVLLALFIFILLWTALILAMRIVTLWFVIMLSPLAFMANLIPGLSSIYNDWKNKLQEALITGPTLMFLLYLSMTLMNTGLSSNLNTSTGDNLVNNGNLINYVLVIGILFFANTTATKAGQSAPGILKNAVGVAGTVATFGLGAYVGAGGYGTGQMLKTGKEYVKGGIKNTDKLAGGSTRAVQIATGGKYNLNDRYEMWKANQKSKTEKGKAFENIPFAGKWMGAVAQQTLGGEAGKKEKYKNTLVGLAEEAKRKHTLNDNPELKKAYNNNIIEETKKLAEADTSVPELIEKLDKTVETSAKKAIIMRIAQLQGLAELASNERYAEIIKEAENDAEILEGILNKELNDGENDGELDAEDISFRDRLARVAKDKKQEKFVLGINEVETSKDSKGEIVRKSKAKKKAEKDLEEVKQLSITSMGTELKNKRYRFESRELIGTNPETGKPIWATEDGKAKRTLNLKIFTDAIEKEDPRVLREPKTWVTYDSETKEKIKQYIQNTIPDEEKTPNQEAALEGLGYSKPKRPAGFRTD